MYDSLWESNPKVQQIRAESEAKGKEEGAVEASQTMFVDVASARFPTLAELAQEQAARIHHVYALRLLAQRVVAASNEDEARELLDSPAA